MGEPQKVAVEFVHKMVGKRCGCCGESWPCRTLLRARTEELEAELERRLARNVQHAARIKELEKALREILSHIRRQTPALIVDVCHEALARKGESGD